MANKRIILLIGLLFIIAGLIGFFLLEREIQNAESQKDTSAKNELQMNITKAKLSDDFHENAQIADLYSNTPYYVPYVSVAEIANLSPDIKKKVDEVFELSQGCYLIKYNPESKSVFMLLQSPVIINDDRYTRHNLQIAEISLASENIKYYNIGSEGEENEVQNAVLQQQKDEEWSFDETVEPYRPLKHTVYDKKKKVLYTEEWSYDDANPVKYQMTDNKGNIVSVKKEIMDGDSGYREEHIFYNEEGSTIRSLTANYDGATLKWFTYYDAQNPGNNITIESVYENGLKIIEKIYNQEYQPVSIYNAVYKGGELVGIKHTDKDGNIVAEFINK